MLASRSVTVTRCGAGPRRMAGAWWLSSRGEIPHDRGRLMRGGPRDRPLYYPVVAAPRQTCESPVNPRLTGPYYLLEGRSQAAEDPQGSFHSRVREKYDLQG